MAACRLLIPFKHRNADVRSLFQRVGLTDMGHSCVLRQLEEHPVLCRLTLDQVNLYIRLAAQLKRDIQLPLPLAQSSPGHVPDILPPTVEEFLSKAVGIPLDCMECSWDILKDYAWNAPPSFLFEENLVLFKEHGWALGLSKSTSSTGRVSLAHISQLA
jgi:hypothetical protein